MLLPFKLSNPNVFSLQFFEPNKDTSTRTLGAGSCCQWIKKHESNSHTCVLAPGSFPPSLKNQTVDTCLTSWMRSTQPATSTQAWKHKSPPMHHPHFCETAITTACQQQYAHRQACKHATSPRLQACSPHLLDHVDHSLSTIGCKRAIKRASV